jgi:membrane-associated protease RseP (regulator of RpoE activity)
MYKKIYLGLVVTTMLICASYAQMHPGCPHHEQCEKEKMVEKEIFVMPEAEECGFLGVVTETQEGGLEIKEIVKESPAEISGLKAGDIILELNGAPVKTPDELRNIIRKTKPGDELRLKVLSEGAEKVLNIRLGKRPGASRPIKKPKREYKYTIAGGGAGYFGPAVSLVDYKNINTVFQNHNLPSLKREHFMFGGGGYGQIERIRIGGYGVGGTQSVGNDSLNVDLSLGLGFFELGYSLVYTKHFLMTPFLGIGGGGITLKITPLTPRPTSLDDILTTPTGVNKVTKSGLVLHPGLAIDIPLSFTGLSIKAGYLYSPVTGSWQLEDQGKINGPDFNLQGFYTSLNIFFGGF